MRRHRKTAGRLGEGLLSDRDLFARVNDISLTGSGLEGHNKDISDGALIGHDL
jgi:hypothetical protein